MMNKKSISPEIISLSWGTVQTADHTYKDAKLFPGGAREWDWNETGTQHSPGILPPDVQELIQHGAEIIILSKGINERLQTAPETKALLEKEGCEYFIMQTKKAVAKYNELRPDWPVGVLIHSTC
jgi:hypothetical protein